MRLNWRLICDLSMSLLVLTIKEFWECVNLIWNVMWYCPTLPQTQGKGNSEWLQFIDCKLPGWWQLQNWTCKFVMWKISRHLHHVFLYFVPLPYNLMKSLLGFLSRFFKYSYQFTEGMNHLSHSIPVFSNPKYTSHQVGTHYQVDLFF